MLGNIRVNVINGGMSSLVGARSEHCPFFEEDALGLIPVCKDLGVC